MKIICTVLLFVCIGCYDTFSQAKGSTLSVESKNKSIRISNTRLEIESNSKKPNIVIWDGKQKNPIPDYGVEGVKWIISYKDSLFGEFIHSKIIKNQPLRYSFIFNRNQDLSVFVQVNIPMSEQMTSGGRIKLLPRSNIPTN
jgi:hypothetical protein